METYCFKLVEELRRRREVDLLSLAGSNDGSVPNIMQLLRFALVTASRLLFGPPLPGLIHVGDMASWPFGLIARIRRPSIRIALSAHGTDVSYGRRKGWLGRLYQIYLRTGAALIGSARVIANSEATAEACRQAGFRDIRIVALASDIRAPDSPPSAPENKLLFAGRLVRRKGLLWFVENVLPLLPQEITLDVAGSLWASEEAAALAHDRVNHLGVLGQDALASAYAGALCVVAPNIELENGEFEGFGLVAVEAAAAGGVVLASNSAGLRSAVKNGVTGILIEAGNAAAWAATIVEVRNWDQPKRSAFLAASIAEVRAHFSWERVATETEAIYGR
ncbi:MAG: glycosyltransferase family 4 protein [Pseudomonadota bacterium]|nr:glycosyltransferase family 4 protein [Pseudomonadota bacterium]